MDRVTNNPEEVQPPTRIKGVHQEVNIILLCEGADGKEYEIVVDSNRRPIPVPYSEEP